MPLNICPQTIRPLNDQDREQWQVLFAAYCAFYREAADQQKLDTVWQWLLSPEHPLEGIIACETAYEENGETCSNKQEKLVGLAHYQAWPQSLSGCDIGYLSDLFVEPKHRRQQLGKKLYQAVLAIGKEKGWPVVSLLTQESNSSARGLYDQFGEKSDYGFYLSEL